MRLCVCLFALLLTVPGYSQERVVLTTPKPTVTEYRISELLLSWNDGVDCTISVRLEPNVAGPEMQHRYSGAAACQMLRALNTANLSTVSLQKRIINQLLADKVLSGAVAGTPETP